MHQSVYTYFIPFKGEVVIFNGLTESFFTIPTNKSQIYQEIIENPDLYVDELPDFIARLKKDGFVTDLEDEISLVKKKLDGLRKPDEYYLMILPTYQCNLRCWYCVQEHEDLWMTEATVDRVRRLIERKLQDSTLRHFHLSWFGGEPLLKYDMIRDITDFSKKTAEKNGKTFSCEITTNGTLLTEKRIAELKSAGVGSYQITIDGTKERHDRVKVLKSKSAYETTLANVNNIVAHSHCTLRFNFTHENLDPDEIIREINQRIDEKNRQNITFLIYKVWQEDAKSVKQDDIDRLYDLGNASHFFSKLPTRGLCYVDRAGFDCIFPNGKVGKCDNMNPAKVYGVLEADGTIHYPDYYNYSDANIVLDAGSDCRECKYLPMCWGPCSMKRPKFIGEDKKVRCNLIDKEAEMQYSIVSLCKNLLTRNGK